VPKGDVNLKNEQRRSDRRRTYLAARIVFNERSSTLDCVVRNLSRNGAMLEFFGPAVAGHSADLFILKRAVSLRASVIWCNGARAGVSTEQKCEARTKRVAETREPV